MRWIKLQKKNTICSKVIEKVLFFAILILLWQFIAYTGVELMHIWKSYTMPTPLGVWSKILKLFSNSSIYLAILASLKRVFIGYILAILIGAVLGILIVCFPYLERNLKPIILGLQTLPSICWLPFAILWYGLNESAIIFVIVIGSAFSVAISVENGFKSVDPILIRAAKTMGANQRELYIKVILPASTPILLSGLKQGWSFAWRALMSGEMMSATLGLGQVLLLGRELADINQVMVVMLLIVVIGSIIDKCIFSNIERSVRKSRGLDRDKVEV